MLREHVPLLQVARAVFPLAVCTGCAEVDKSDGSETVDASALGGFSGGAEDAGADDERPEGSDGVGTGGAGSGGSTASVDACSWTDLGICYEFEDYTYTEGWCTDLGTIYGLTTDYGESCEDEFVLACDLTEAGGDYPSDAARIMGYFADWYWPEEEAYDICYSINGEPL